MMAIALSLLACAVFAALTVVGVTAALNSARIDDMIGEVFSPWIEDPFAGPGAAKAAAAARSPAVEAGRPRTRRLRTSDGRSRPGPETLALKEGR